MPLRCYSVLHPEVPIALIGLPNCGKTALFNRLTGSRQKVANYPGVTVERKEGRFIAATGEQYCVLDLPGTYSLTPTTLDEAITRDVALGRLSHEKRPVIIVLVADATHLALSLRLALEAKLLGLPMILALNMSDIAKRRGFALNHIQLEHELGIPVVKTIAVRQGGTEALVFALNKIAKSAAEDKIPRFQNDSWEEPSSEAIRLTHLEAARILANCEYQEPKRSELIARIDQVLLHPFYGMAILGGLLFCVFQAVFSWATWPMAWIDLSVSALSNILQQYLAVGPLRSLLIDGVLAGVGSVIIFLPQILILFCFILALEDSGYLPRAAYLLDRVMGSVGLSGRAFIPLLSSFACAVPGIMATRTIPNLRDRITTIMVAPLMTCSARLPVYALIIAAFIPTRSLGWFNLQGVVLFLLYFAGILSAMLVAWVFKLVLQAPRKHVLLLELPDYQWPNLQTIAIGLWERAKVFLGRVGGIILALMILLWVLSSFPGSPTGATGAAIEYSIAGYIGRALAVVLEPIGFNWQICIALIPGLAAREVAVAALGTVYALSASGDAVAGALLPVIATQWSISTAMALLAWYVFAPQCLATLAVVKRETNSWRYPLFMAAYMFSLAYLAAFLTFQITTEIYSA